MDFELWNVIINTVTAAGGGVILKKAWSIYQSTKKERREHRDHVNKSLGDIKQQLYPNGGASLYDHILSLKFGQRNSWELQKLAVWESDPQGQITYVTPTLCEMVGCQRDDLMHNSWKYLVSDDEADGIFQRWKNCVASASEFNERYNFKLKNRPGWFQEVEAEAIHNKDTRGIVISSMGRFTKIGEPYQNSTT